jgi:hypothetical protein
MEAVLLRLTGGGETATYRHDCFQVMQVFLLAKVGWRDSSELENEEGRVVKYEKKKEVKKGDTTFIRILRFWYSKLVYVTSKYSAPQIKHYTSPLQRSSG